MSDIAKKILKQAKDAAKQRIEKENQQTEIRISADVEVINKILEMVKDRLVYKEFTPEHSSRKSYIVVTEEIVLQDYNNPPKYGSGTSIKQVEASYYTYRHTQIIVNGHHYYHASDLIAKYKHDANDVMKKAEKEYELARERKEAIDSMAYLEPVMKELVLNYNKHLGYLSDDPTTNTGN